MTMQANGYTCWTQLKGLSGCATSVQTPPARVAVGVAETPGGSTEGTVPEVVEGAEGVGPGFGKGVALAGV